MNAGATKEFEALAPDIPCVSGDENDLTGEMIQSARALALYRAMKRQGKASKKRESFSIAPSKRWRREVGK